jgi:hypothetical protein
MRARMVDASKASKRVMMESALRDSSGNLVGDGSFNLPLRVDMVVSNGELKERSIPIDSEKMLKFAPLSIQWDSQLKLVVAPFCWDSCGVLLKRQTSEDDASAIAAWFMECFDPDDQKSPDDDGLYGVVHFLSDPKISESSTFFEIDFGSASTNAFTRLLDVISSLGVSEVSIGQDDGLS